MAIIVNRFRMSLLWTARFASLVADASPAGAPLAALGHVASYEPIFTGLLQAPATPITPAAGAPALVLPWRPQSTQWFWCRYLNANPIRKVKASFAFWRLVPFRRQGSPAPGLDATLPASLAGQPQLETMIAEAWFHPHMVSVAIHVTVTGAMSVADLAAAGLALRHDRVLRVPGDAALHKLDELGTRYLQAMYLEAVGEPNAGPLPPADPFSVVTVLQGDTAGAREVEPGGAVHRALDAVTAWDVDHLGALAAGRISGHADAGDGPLLLGHRRARAVWDPGRFERADQISLSCYHRNLLMGALQTEALLGFARVAQDEAAAGRRPKTIRDCEDPVLKRVIDLHAGNDETYRSSSLKRFIDEHPLRASVDALSARIWSPAQLPPAAPPPAPV
ncbi:MAG TPA: hypothetical protein VGD37_07600 [Kofleriaceae bacterium]